MHVDREDLMKAGLIVAIIEGIIISVIVLFFSAFDPLKKN